MDNKIITFSFCEPFIDNLTKYINTNFLNSGQDLSRLAIVFGGKRPALFVKRELSRTIKKSFYPPKFFTIDEFMNDTARKRDSFSVIQDLDSCYLIYKLAKQRTPQILKGRETFAQFLPWTREILKFIAHLDLERVDSKSLQSIEANAQIGYAVPADINRLLENIVTLREAYHEVLIKDQQYSRGLQYFRAAEGIADAKFDEFDQILFCNFFYFHRSEETVVKNLYERGKATLIFQGDQRKWPVLDRIARNFSCQLYEGEQPETPAFDLKLYSGFDAHSQIGIVREILRKIKNLNDTVIVLPNPDQIIPLLSEMTAITQDFNISMGYPLRRSSLYTLCEFVFHAQLSKKEQRYYAKDYLKVLRHPFIKNLKLAQNSTIMRILIHKIEEILTGKEKTSLSGTLFIELDDMIAHDELYMMTLETLERLGIKTNRQELQTALEAIHEILFYEWERVDDFKKFANVLTNFLDVLVQKSFLKNYPLNINIATKMYAIKDELWSASFSEELFPQEEIFKVFEDKIERELISFIGSPLKGLQMLGLLETRSLNFENVIILDVNEGVLPKLSIYEPLIPREVMISLNLDRLELEEEIQHYQFMRLLSSAKNVHLIYQESKDKEKSRFIEELIWEEQKSKKELDLISVYKASFEVNVTTPKASIRKTPEMIETLKKHKYSASSINTYLRNPMDFYWQYVLGLKEQEDLLDEPEARHVGVFVHELLEHSFMPFINKKPKINAIFRKRVEQLFEQKFEDTFGRTMKSDAFLLKSVLNERINRFLDNEEFNEERQIEKILYLENRFEETIALACGDIQFTYIVDRVDKLKNGTVMIVDYKTGSVDQMPKAIDRIARMELSRESIRDTVKSFQVPLYFHYLDRQFKGQPINAALYNLRTLELHKFMDQKMDYSSDQINGAFMRALNFIVEEILNPNVDFVLDDSNKYS